MKLKSKHKIYYKIWSPRKEKTCVRKNIGEMTIMQKIQIKAGRDEEYELDEIANPNIWFDIKKREIFFRLSRHWVAIAGYLKTKGCKVEYFNDTEAYRIVISERTLRQLEHQGIFEWKKGMDGKALTSLKAIESL